MNEIRIVRQERRRTRRESHAPNQAAQVTTETSNIGLSRLTYTSE